MSPAGSRFTGKSTEKLDLLASWREPLQKSEGTRSIETHVLEVPISLGDPDPLGTHGDPVPIATYTKAPTDSFQFNEPPNQSDARARSFLARHEFGDTRHRRVTYQLVATTRFKEYFPERITSDPANITRTATFENVEVLNSVRPPALEVTSIIPAFQWDRSQELTSRRAGGSLRILSWEQMVRDRGRRDGGGCRRGRWQ